VKPVKGGEDFLTKNEGSIKIKIKWVGSFLFSVQTVKKGKNYHAI